MDGSPGSIVLYRERRSALVACIEEELGAMVDIVGAEAGVHLAMILPNRSRSDLEVSERAARQNLWLWPLSPSYLGEVPRPGFILGFGSTAVADMSSGVRKLRKLLSTK